jgi:hypothetical protein
MIDIKIAGDLIAVLGALILFFSWIITNTFGEKLKAATSAYSDAERDHDIFYKLHDMKHDIATIITHVIQVGQDVDGIRNQAQSLSGDDPQSNHRVINGLRHEIALASLSAQQLDRARDFHFLHTKRLAQSADATVNTERNRLFQQLDSFYSRKNTLLVEMNHNYQAAQEADRLESGLEEHARLQQLIRDECLEPLGFVLKQLVSYYNEESSRLLKERKKAKQQDNKAKRLALILYIVGTIFALGGTVIEKLATVASPDPIVGKPSGVT